jgi:hypothetical protein
MVQTQHINKMSNSVKMVEKLSQRERENWRDKFARGKSGRADF